LAGNVFKLNSNPCLPATFATVSLSEGVRELVSKW
jgi:hypothetical protein